MSFELILRGVSPVRVFESIVEGEPGVDRYELASRFVDYFERVDWLAVQVIWNWRRPEGRAGLSDECVDLQILTLLRKAGYDLDGMASEPLESPSDGELSEE